MTKYIVKTIDREKTKVVADGWTIDSHGFISFYDESKEEGGVLVFVAAFPEQLIVSISVISTSITKKQ